MSASTQPVDFPIAIIGAGFAGIGAAVRLADDGSNHSLYPGFAAEYALRTRRFRAADYQISGF